MRSIDEWFVRRKGFAFGLMWAGTGTSGIVVPFLLEWLLNDYGYQTALRVWALILVSTKKSTSPMPDDSWRKAAEGIEVIVSARQTNTGRLNPIPSPNRLILCFLVGAYDSIDIFR